MEWIRFHRTQDSVYWTRCKKWWTQSNKIKFHDDDDKDVIALIYFRWSLLLLFQVQHGAHNLFEQIKIAHIYVRVFHNGG